MSGQATRLTSSYIKEEYGSWKYIYCFIPVSEGTIDRDTMRRMRDFSTFNISHELTACPLLSFLPHNLRIQLLCSLLTEKHILAEYIFAKHLLFVF